MLNNKSFLAIIPARAGSKRLPNKNILDLNGKPLISWTIKAALDSQYLDKIVVTTDSKAIQEIALNSKVEAPFLRPEHLSNDTASSYDTVLHSVEYYEQMNNLYFDYVVLLQPTSPLRTSENIDSAIELLISKEADAVISVAESNHSPLRMNTLPLDYSMKSFVNRELSGKRTQDLEKYYYIDGSIYICNIDRLKKEKTFLFHNNIYSYVMPKINSWDIDDLVDFKIAETLQKENSKVFYD